MNSSIKRIDASNQLAFRGCRKEIAQAISRTLIRETAAVSPALVPYWATGSAGKSIAFGMFSKVCIDTIAITRNFENLSSLNIWKLAGCIISGIKKCRWI